MKFLLILGCCIVFLGLALAGMAIRMFFKKNGEFKKHCATIEFEDGERLTCRCTAERHEDCEFYELHHGPNSANPIQSNSNAH